MEQSTQRVHLISFGDAVVAGFCIESAHVITDGDRFFGSQTDKTFGDKDALLAVAIRKLLIDRIKGLLLPIAVDFDTLPPLCKWNKSSTVKCCETCGIISSINATVSSKEVPYFCIFTA